MDGDHLDPEQIKRAKELAAGPLGKEMTKYPLRFATSVILGRRPSEDECVKVKNGTATLIELQDRPIAVTCNHVMEEYWKINTDSDVVFQIGNMEFDPSERIIGASSHLDLVSIDLSGLNLCELLGNGDIGSLVFPPVSWPPKDVCAGDYVAFGGFVGKWKEYVSWNRISFDAFSLAGCRVASVSEERFVCQLEREWWVKSSPNAHGRDGKDLHEFGGLSGGPVFIHRGLYCELVGIISEFSEEYDLMYIRPIRFINDDGSICKDFE